MEFSLRPMTPTDNEAVTGLLDVLWGDNPLMRAQYGPHRALYAGAPVSEMSRELYVMVGVA